MSLSVVVDGVALAEADARAFWDRFSRYMDDHPRDLVGFAKAEGLASVHPQMGADGAVLVASRTALQRPYANASSGSATKPTSQPSSGSPGHQSRGNRNQGGSKSSKKRG